MRDSIKFVDLARTAQQLARSGAVFDLEYLGAGQQLLRLKCALQREVFQ